MLISHYGLLANSTAISRAICTFARGVAASHNRFSGSSELVPIKSIDTEAVSAFYRGSGRIGDTSSEHSNNRHWQPLAHRGSGRISNASATISCHCDQRPLAYRGSGRIQRFFQAA